MANREHHDDNPSTEQSITSCYAVVYDRGSPGPGQPRQWLMAGEGGWSENHLCEDSIDHSFRILSWTVRSQQVLMNCNVSQKCKYIKRSANFHEFVDEGGNRHGLGFNKSESAIKQATYFMLAVKGVIAGKIDIPHRLWPLRNPTHTQLPISIRATQQSEKAVFGFVHAMVDSAPRSLCELIHRYFLMLLNTNKSTCAELVWRFDDPTSMSMLQCCSKDGDVRHGILVSRQFEICGCIFRLEITSAFRDKGRFAMWLSLVELPVHIDELCEIDFAVRCDEMAYEARTRKLAKHSWRGALHHRHGSVDFGPDWQDGDAIYTFGFRKYAKGTPGLTRCVFHVSVDIKGAMNKGKMVSLLTEEDQDDMRMLKVYKRPRDALDD